MQIILYRNGRCQEIAYHWKDSLCCCFTGIFLFPPVQDLMSSDSKVGSIDHMSTFPDTIYRMSLNKGLRAWSGTQAQMWSYMLVNMVGCASPSLEKIFAI